MKTVERINNTFVRHEWKTIAAGVAAGRSYLVENHGKPEALIIAPDRGRTGSGPAFDVDAHFARVLAKLPRPSSFGDPERSPET